MDNMAITPEEQRWLKPLFNEYDLSDSNIVMGDRLRPLLEQSGLPPQQLSQIWQLVDTENRGFLDYDGFAKCMRLVHHTQQGHVLSPRLANIPSGIPDFSRSQQLQSSPPEPAIKQPVQSPRDQSVYSPGISPLTALGTGGSTLSANGETRIPPLTTADKKRYGALFDISNESPDRLMDGHLAREIFLKAQLPQDTLSKVWSLVDIEGRGKLTKNEFVVAMHLIQSLISRSMPKLPSSLSASWLPWLGSGSAHLRQGSLTSVISDQGHMQNSKFASLNMTHSGSERRVASVIIDPKERSQYDSIFDSLDPQRNGIIGPNETVPLLKKSGLSEDVLAKIWDLSDTRCRGKLDKGDFAMAMHYVKAKLNGMELPDQLNLGSDATNGQQEKDTPSTGSLSPQKPLSPQVSASAASKSSSKPAPGIDDLVNFDNSIFRPLEPVKSKKSSSKPEENKFVPTTLFGQQLLHHKQGMSQSSRSTGQPVPKTNYQSAANATETSTYQSAFREKNIAQGISELDSKVAANKTEKSKADEELASVLNQKIDLERKLQELKVTYDDGTRKVHETQQQVKLVRDDIKQLERDIALRSSGLDAIKTQHDQEKKVFETLKARKTAMESQCANYQNEMDKLSKEIDMLKKEQESHKAAIFQHESRCSNLQQQLQQSRWQYEQLHREVDQQQQRSLNAQKQAESLQQQINKAHETQPNQKLVSSMNIPSGIIATAAANAMSHSEEKPSSTAQSNLTSAPAPILVESPLNRSCSIESAPDSVTGSVPNMNNDTPHTSPPTSEANYAAIDSNIPTFTLPMERIHSASSSVVNNPPQSIRGDLGSEPSDRPSPEFPPTPTGNYPLTDHDSFEFLDAAEELNDNSLIHNIVESSDEEEPASAIPFKYGHSTHTAPGVPSMPGAFPTSKETMSKNQDASQHLYPQIQETNKTDSSDIATSVVNKNMHVVDSTHSSVPSPSLPASANNKTAAVDQMKDEFDEFEGLEDAKEDDNDDLSTSFISNHAHNAGPDEWQQLFTSNNTQNTEQDQIPSPNQVSRNGSAESREIAELSSMGFSEDAARSALKMHNHNLSEATNFLLDSMR